MKYLVYTLLIGFIISCSNTVDFESDEIQGRVTQEELEVFNNLNRSIYYFTVERATSASILWTAISGEENEIKSLQSKNILLNEIYGYEKGREILFYYWSVKEPESSDIKYIVIQTE